MKKDQTPETLKVYLKKWEIDLLYQRAKAQSCSMSNYVARLIRDILRKHV